MSDTIYHRWPRSYGGWQAGSIIQCEGADCPWCAYRWAIVTFPKATDEFPDMSDVDANERFRNAILNFCANKTYNERMRLIAGILTAFGDLEAAGDNAAVARVLFDASTKIAALGEQAPMPDTDLASDRLEGVAAIARFRGEDKRRTEYLIASGVLPHGREGRRIVASKRILRADHLHRTQGDKL